MSAGGSMAAMNSSLKGNKRLKGKRITFFERKGLTFRNRNKKHFNAGREMTQEEKYLFTKELKIKKQLLIIKQLVTLFFLFIAGTLIYIAIFK